MNLKNVFLFFHLYNLKFGFMLSLDQSNEFRRFKKLVDFLRAFFKVFQGYDPFRYDSDDLITNFGIFDGLIPNKDVLVTAVTGEKAVKKDKLIKKAVFVSKKARAFAKKKKDKQLEGQVKINKSTLKRCKEADVEGLIIKVVDVIRSKILPDAGFAIYLITDDTLTDVLDLAADFKKAIAAPGLAANSLSVAGSQIDAVIEKLHENLEQLELLVDFFEETDAAFVEGFYLNSKLEELGVQHNGLHGTVVNAVTKEPIAGALVAVVGTKRSKVANENGVYDLERVRNGACTIEASANGFVSKQAAYRFKRGRHDDLDFELEPVV